MVVVVVVGACAEEDL